MPWNKAVFTDIHAMFEAELIRYFLLGTFTQTHVKNREDFMQIKWENSTNFYNCATSLSAAMIVFYLFPGLSEVHAGNPR